MRASLLLLPLASLLPGCFDDTWAPPDVVADRLVPGALHVGALLPLSDGAGLSHRDALLLASERVAAAGRPGGRELVPIVLDSAPSRTVGAAAVADEVQRRVRLLASYGVPALIVAGDNATLASRRAAASDGLLVLTYAASSDAVLAALGGRRPPTFRRGPPASAVGPVLATLAREAGHEALATVRLAGDAFGEELTAAAQAEFETHGGRVAASIQLDPARPSELRERLVTLLAAGPDVVLPALPAEHLARVVNEASALGAKPSWVLPHTAVSPAFVDNVTDLGPLSGAPALAPAPGQGAAYSEFEALFLARFGRAPGPLDSLAWDALHLVALAAARAAAELPHGTPPVGRDLARHLPPVTAAPGERHSPDGLASALRALAAGASVEYVGAYAEYDLRPSGESVGELPLQVYRIDAETGTFLPTEQRVVRAD